MLTAETISSQAAALHSSDITPEIRAAVAQSLLDWLGVAVLGARSDVAAILVDLAAADPGPAPVVGTQVHTSDLLAALANGSHGHALDFDDTHAPTLLHASAPVWPALLAAAATRPTSGPEAITAYVAGVRAETQIASGIGETLSARGFHVTGTIGHLGAAMASGRAVGLDAAGMDRALGIAATQAAGLTASFGSMCKPLHAGKAAMDGLLAAKLARAGFTGPSRVLEREDGLLATLLREAWVPLPDTDTAWPQVGLSVKPYPSCLLTHASIEACLLVGQQLGPSDEIERVGLTVPALAVQLAGNAAPDTGLAAKFSLAYCAARALLSGPLGPADFTAGAVADESVRRLMKVVHIVSDPAMDSTAATADLLLQGGRSLTAHVTLASGHPDNPLSADQLAEKFRRLAGTVLPHARVQQLAEAVLHLDHVADISALIALTMTDQAARPAGTSGGVSA